MLVHSARVCQHCCRKVGTFDEHLPAKPDPPPAEEVRSHLGVGAEVATVDRSVGRIVQFITATLFAESQLAGQQAAKQRKSGNGCGAGGPARGELAGGGADGNTEMTGRTGGDSSAGAAGSSGSRTFLSCAAEKDDYYSSRDNVFDFPLLSHRLHQHLHLPLLRRLLPRQLRLGGQSRCNELNDSSQRPLGCRHLCFDLLGDF